MTNNKTANAYKFEVDFDEAGQMAFEAYSRAVDGRTFDGQLLPNWDDLSDKVRNVWSMAADGLLDSVSDKRAPAWTAQEQETVNLALMIDKHFPNVPVPSRNLFALIAKMAGFLDEFGA